MEIHLKKTLKIIIYSTFIVFGAVLALLPFMKKGEDFSSNYSSDVHEASADVPAVSDPYYSSSGGDDDGGGI